MDTLNFYQLSQSAMGIATYNFGKIKTKQNMTLSANYQVSGQNQGAISDLGLFGNVTSFKIPSKVINGNLGHNILFIENKISLTTGLNANYSILTNFNTLFIGPSLNIGKPFLKNLLKLSVGTTYNQVLVNSVKTNQVFNYRLSANYAPKLKNDKIGKFNFTFSASYMQKLKTISTAIAFSEFTGNVGLSYNF